MARTQYEESDEEEYTDNDLDEEETTEKPVKNTLPELPPRKGQQVAKKQPQEKTETTETKTLTLQEIVNLIQYHQARAFEYTKLLG